MYVTIEFTYWRQNLLLSYIRIFEVIVYPVGIVSNATYESFPFPFGNNPSKTFPLGLFNFHVSYEVKMLFTLFNILQERNPQNKSIFEETSRNCWRKPQNEKFLYTKVFQELFPADNTTEKMR